MQLDQSRHESCPCRYNCCTLWWCTNYTPQFQPRTERTLQGCMQNVFVFYSVDKKKYLNSFNNLGQPSRYSLPTSYQKQSQLLSYMHTCIIHCISWLCTAPFNSLDTQRMRNDHTCSQSIIQTSNCADYKSSNNDSLFNRGGYLNCLGWS